MNLDRNKASIVEAVDAGLLAGAVTLVWQRDAVLQVNELGYRDVDARLPMQRDTIFRIASMTKPATVAAAMSLIEEGRLSLDDRVSTWLPELSDMQVLVDPLGPLDRTVPAERHITVDDLMTHRSGLAYMFSVLGPISDAYRKLPTRQDQDRWLSELSALPLVHQPGERLTYSHATDVLGIALSRIEGKPLSQVLDERILGPLGMSDTGFSVGAGGRRRAATMYQLDRDCSLRDDVMGPAPIVDPPFCTGGAGLWSTVDDYLRFARMLLDDGTLDGVRVLSRRSVELMRTDRLTDEQKRYDFLGSPFWVGRGFGLNLSVVTDPARSRQLFGPGGLGTFSWPGAYGTWWQADPSADLILIYLIQNLPNMNVDAAAAVAGNTSLAKLQTAQPRFVRRTYEALER
ncbi:beta-lactamase family protein [Mycobacterium sp. Y57]|uniref:serine hydrolase domain-containing protein n=1 Tax=Mycolicibacterium xanthum TaxID=2796469 RepID=UPI001C84F60C|nr:serine hydrolase domain-containing protein [Mycolicibacterium xanthum]MBX7432991.1 beta-lactamase family protein [Mycolicibacterium xanthum]